MKFNHIGIPTKKSFNGEMDCLPTNENIFYIPFYIKTFSDGYSAQINYEDRKIPKRLDYEALCKYCGSAHREISDILDEAKRKGRYYRVEFNNGLPIVTNRHSYRLKPEFNQCSFHIGQSPQLKFNIYGSATSMQRELQDILDGKIEKSDLSFYTDKNASTSKLDAFVKSLKTVIPDLIRGPEVVEFTGFRLSPE